MMTNQMDVEYDAKTRKVKITMTRHSSRYGGRFGRRRGPVVERKVYTLSRADFDRALAQIEVAVPLPEAMRTKVKS